MTKLDANSLFSSQLLRSSVGARTSVEQAAARLSSGSRLNSASDDAASLAIANALQAQRRGAVVGERNVGDAVGMVQTASGSLSGVSDIVSRMRELATQSANGALNDGDRAGIQAEFEQLQGEVARIRDGATFNGKSVLRDRTPTGNPPQPPDTTETFQVGSSTSETRSVDFGAPDLRGLVKGQSSVATADGARAALDTLDQSLAAVNDKQSYFGAVLNDFDTVASNSQTSRQSLAESESRLRDTDVAEEVSNRVRAQVMEAAKSSVLVHVLASNERVRQLLKA